MAFTGCMDLRGNIYSYDGMMDPQNYLGEDYTMNFGTGLDPSLLDPSLRDMNDPMNHYYQGWREPEQPLQRYLGESQKILFTSGHIAPCQATSLQRDFNTPYEVIGTIPHTFEQSRGSPLSSCSSATSPRTDTDWYQESRRQTIEDGLSSRSTPHLAQGLSELGWPSRQLSQVEIPPIGHINLQAVQAFADTQEGTFQEDEYLMDMDTKADFSAEVDYRTVKQEGFRGQRYRHSSDEGIGASLKSEESPEAKPVVLEDDDIDAEGEDVDENEDDANEVEATQAEEEDADTDYKPKSSSRRKSRRTSRPSPSHPNNKKSKVIKSTASPKSKFCCKTCGHASKDAATLVKHVAGSHTRPYVCTFSFAGCNSTFGNKNEWKRHVYSQHLGLQYWLCNVDACGKSKSKSQTAVSGNDFNRKDLFTQHLRRMHAPFAVKRQKCKSAGWEERVKALQASCLKIRREAPTITRCPVRTCAQIFEGPSSWDDRMEHVGRHLEKTSSTTASSSTSSSAGGHGDVVRDVIEQESDEFMIEWCLTEKIIERGHSGGYRLCAESGGEPVREDDEEQAEGECDADGEDE